MKHLNLEFERLEQRIAPGAVHFGSSHGSKGSKGSKGHGSKSHGSKGSKGSR